MRTEKADVTASKSRGFTLIELLVAVGILSLLVAVLLPSLHVARELTRATRAHAELKGLGVALEMYEMDQQSDLPPVRVNCNDDLFEHWCQLPVELAEGGYVPAGPPGGGLAAAVEDVFNPGFTYKYAAPGPGLMNGDPGYQHTMWIPEDFPHCASEEGDWCGATETAAVKWALWSLGPDRDSEKAKDFRAPLTRDAWYAGPGDTGLLVHFADRTGQYHHSQ